MTPKQRVFADEYLKDGNASRAYRVAYPNCNGDTARNEGCKLLAKPCIKSYIEENQNAMSSKRIADAEEIMAYFSAVMRGEIMDQTVTPSGEVVDSKPKMSDRNAAAEKLARILGIDKKIDRDKLKLERERFEHDKEKNAIGGDDNGVVIEI